MRRAGSASWRWLVPAILCLGLWGTGQPAARAEPAAKETMSITLKLGHSSLTFEKTEVVYAEDQGVMKASYRVFHFARREFESKVGKQGKVKDGTEVKLTVLAAKERKAETGEGAAPEGGIDITDYRCRITSVRRPR